MDAARAPPSPELKEDFNVPVMSFEDAMFPCSAPDEPPSPPTTRRRTSLLRSRRAESPTRRPGPEVTLRRSSLPTDIGAPTSTMSDKLTEAAAPRPSRKDQRRRAHPHAVYLPTSMGLRPPSPPSPAAQRRHSLLHAVDGKLAGLLPGLGGAQRRSSRAQSATATPPPSSRGSSVSSRNSGDRRRPTSVFAAAAAAATPKRASAVAKAIHGGASAGRAAQGDADSPAAGLRERLFGLSHAAQGRRLSVSGRSDVLNRLRRDGRRSTSSSLTSGLEFGDVPDVAVPEHRHQDRSVSPLGGWAAGTLARAAQRRQAAFASAEAANPAEAAANSLADLDGDDESSAWFHQPTPTLPVPVAGWGAAEPLSPLTPLVHPDERTPEEHVWAPAPPRAESHGRGSKRPAAAAVRSRIVAETLPVPPQLAKPAVVPPLLPLQRELSPMPMPTPARLFCNIGRQLRPTDEDFAALVETAAEPPFLAIRRLAQDGASGQRPAAPPCEV